MSDAVIVRCYEPREQVGHEEKTVEGVKKRDKVVVIGDLNDKVVLVWSILWDLNGNGETLLDW